MAEDDYAPVVSDDEEEQRRRMLAPNYPPVTTPNLGEQKFQSAPALGSTEDLEQGAHNARHAYAPVEPTPSPAAQRVNDLTSKGMPPVQPLHGWKKALDVVGQTLAPTRPLEHALRYGKQDAYASNLAGAEKDLTAEGTAATAPAAREETNAKPALTEAQTEEASAKAHALREPPEKTGQTPEELTIHDLMTGENGAPRTNPQTGKPYSYMEAYQSVKQAGQVKPERPDTPEQQFYDSPEEKGKTQTQKTQDWAKASQRPEQPQRPQQQLAVVDGKVVELKPGMAVPEGTESLSGDLKGSKPTADEQRRADLSENLNENLQALEEIVKRKPGLFGPLHGRLTSLKATIGTSDPDIAALETIKHQIGMAQISAHGMRSAHGIAAAADSILNSFNNSPEAVQGAIDAARNSVQTFQHDVDRNKPGAKGEAQAGPKTEDLKPPKEADQGMKWQHRTANGKTEWRQVKQ